MPEAGGPAPAAGPIVLVGLMGSGKTTVGRKLARLIGHRFVDADVAVDARTGRSVADWFALEGEPAFRAVESEVLASLLADPDPLVIGAGGGVVVAPGNRTMLRAPGVSVIYLHAEPAFLASRAQAKPHRPLLTGEPGEVLAQMYLEHDPWYHEVADAVVEVRPAHEAGEKPKWRLAESVAEALVALGRIRPEELRTPTEVGGTEAAP